MVLTSTTQAGADKSAHSISDELNISHDTRVIGLGVDGSTKEGAHKVKGVFH